MDPVNLSRNQALSMTPSQRNALKALTTQQSVTDYPYYSEVCFRAAIAQEAMTGLASYTFPKGDTRRAFSYGRGQSGVSAGFSDAIDGLMTLAETNLIKPNETIGGQQVQIDGIAIQAIPAMGDGKRYGQARLLAQIAKNVSIQMTINAEQNTFPLGVLPMIPGAGGLVGPGNDDLSFIPAVYDKAPLAGNIGDPFQFAQNGWQTRGNYYRFPSGIIWNPAGLHDSLLNVLFTNEREFVLYTGGTPERQEPFTVPGEAPTSFAPTSIGVVLLVQLIAQIVGPRTRTA